MNGPQRQRGVAILTAMLVVTIGTIVAVNIMWQASLDIRRAEAALAGDQGMLYMQGAEAWAADILRLDAIESPESDDLSETWAIALQPLPIDGGTIVGQLEDLQGRFNLNNLITEGGTEDEWSRAQFERLLARLELDPALAGAVLDWIDPDIEMHFPNGGEDAAYADTDPPYRTPNSILTSPSELLAVRGFDAESYAKLAPYVTALPIGTKINVNTASNVVLASLSDELDLSTADSLIEERAGADFPDVDAVFEGLLEPAMLQRIDGVTSHFLLTATVTLGTNQLTMRSVLQRDPSGITRAVFRSLGVQ